jgi:DNA-binding transcriptional LysR family regulator
MAAAGWHGEPPVFVGFDEANAHLPEPIWLARHFFRERTAFRTNSQFAQAAARAGAGIALFQHFIGRTDSDFVLCRFGKKKIASIIILRWAVRYY